MTRVLRTMSGLAMIASAALALAAPAAADTPKTLDAIKAAGALAAGNRIASLTPAISRVTSNEYLTDAHRGAMLTTLNADLAAMHTLAGTIAADTAVDKAAADYHSIFTDYRVYAVALPQSRYAAAADCLTDSALPKLNDAYTKLAAALAGPDKGKSTPELQADLADMSAKLADATTQLNGLADHALAVTPTQYDNNHGVLAPTRSALRTAQADVTTARADANAILAGLS